MPGSTAERSPPATQIQTKGEERKTNHTSLSLLRSSHESLPFFPTSSGRCCCCCCGQVWFEWQMTLMQTQHLVWARRSSSMGSLRASSSQGHREKLSLWDSFPHLLSAKMPSHGTACWPQMVIYTDSQKSHTDTSLFHQIHIFFKGTIQINTEARKARTIGCLLTNDCRCT